MTKGKLATGIVAVLIAVSAVQGDGETANGEPIAFAQTAPDAATGLTTTSSAAPTTTRAVETTTRAPAPPTTRVDVTTTGAPDCHPSYTGACVPVGVEDVDCRGGSGNGPYYVGRVTVVGPDVYRLDGDGDGIGCEGS